MKDLKSNQTDRWDVEDFSEQDLEELMASYKKELARIYKLASAKKKLMAERKMPNLKSAMDKCNEEMREDINALKSKYGIHY